MALTKEDGSIVSGADTYANVDDLRAYATKRGATVPADDDDCEVLLISAMDWLAAQSERWKGTKVQWDQPLDWPRYCVVIGGYELPSDEIPADIVKAQCQLAIDSQTIDLQPSVDVASQQGPVVEKTVDVLSVKYADPAVNRSSSWFAKASGFLSKYFAAGANQVKLVRG